MELMLMLMLYQFRQLQVSLILKQKILHTPTHQDMTATQIRNNRIFGILLLLSETVLIFMFGFFIAYTPSNRAIGDDYFLIASFLLLAICGFGLITGYINSAATASLTHVLIMLGLSIQLYFPFRGFWQIIGLSGLKWTRENSNILPISVTNFSNDRQVSQMLVSSPLTDYIACFISLIVGYSALIGRIGNLQVYFLTVIGTFIYEFNSMIFWRIFVTDCGFGMRIFLFAGCMGIFASLLLGKKEQETTILHSRFSSEYYFQTLNLFGAIVIWCLLPVLNWSDLWHSTSVGTDSYILHIVSLNMWFALCGSVIGSFCGSLALYKRLSVHTIVFSVFTGGIAYSSISDVYLNPGLAMGIGTIVGFLCALLSSKVKAKMNEKGVVDSNGVLSSYLVPGLIAGILSAIFHANGAESSALYKANFDTNRTRFQQGGIQVAGFFIAIGLGIFAGVIIGLLSRAAGSRVAQEQFDSSLTVREKPLETEQKEQSQNRPVQI